MVAAVSQTGSSDLPQMLVDQLVPRRKSRRQLGVMSHNHKNRFLLPVEIEQQGSDHVGRFVIEIAGRLIA